MKPEYSNQDGEMTIAVANLDRVSICAFLSPNQMSFSVEFK